MTRILMVCLGNICRSPLAQGILESKLSSTNFYIDSAGTASFHIGASPDKRSVLTANKFGVDISHQTARQFKTSDFDDFDIIYAMDASNFDNLKRLATNEYDASKIKLILDENPNSKLKNVPDPYYGDLNDFEHVFHILDKTCDHIVNQFTQN